jgi:hypothetical protein
VDRGFVGVSGPVFGPDDAILGSIGVVIRARLLEKSPELLSQLTAKVGQASADLTAALKSNGAEAEPPLHARRPARKASRKSAKPARKSVPSGRKRRVRRT